jgi:prepilin peptidase CpaA
MILSFIVLQLLLIVAFIYDIRLQIIPNLLNGLILLSGLLFSVYLNQWSGFIDSTLGMLTGLGLTFVLFIWRAIAAGDVKLFAAVGAYLGAEQISVLLVISIFIAGGLAILFWLKHRALKGTTMPFMYAVFPAALLVVWI